MRPEPYFAKGDDVGEITKKLVCDLGYPLDVGIVGFVEQRAETVAGLSGHPDLRADELLLVIESFYNYLAEGSINDKRKYFVGKQVSGIGAVLLKKLANFALNPDRVARQMGITQKHEYIYVVGAKQQAWDNYREFGFRPIGTNAMTWRVHTPKLIELVGKAKVTCKEREPSTEPRRVKAPSLFRLALNAATLKPAAKPNLDPADATLRQGARVVDMGMKGSTKYNLLEFKDE